MNPHYVALCNLITGKSLAVMLRGAKALLFSALVLATGCGGNNGSDKNDTPSARASLPIPKQVQTKINADASNVQATISIDGGAEQPMTISGRSATFQANGLSVGAHQIVIRFYQTLGSTRIVLAQSTSEVTVAAGQVANVAPEESSYDTASYDEDHDQIPNAVDEDNDNDSISDENEVAYGWNPLSDDTDGNGVKDGDEVPALAIAAPIPAGVQAKIDASGVVVTAGITVGDRAEQGMTIADGKANFDVLALLPGDHVVVITFYQRFGSQSIVLARHTSTVTVVAGQAATLGDAELIYDTVFDQDNDQTQNIADNDNDGDTVADVNDPFPLDPAETVDTDGDGIGNTADTDDDGDTVADTSDAFPLNSAESVDTDSDGTGNNADTDDDNDSISDADEARYGKNPLSADSDNDAIPDVDEIALQVSGRGFHSCVLLFSHKVKCWGLNGDGQTNSLSIVSAKAVRTSPSHSCAILNDGAVSCWGNNEFDQLNGASLSGASDVQLAEGVTCGIIANNALSCRGDLDGDLLTPDHSIEYFVNLNNGEFLSLGVSESHSCVVVPGRIISCYGSNSSGQLGDETSLLSPRGPTTVPNITTALTVGVGNSHTCALLQSGGVRCWGSNTTGQLGAVTNTSNSTEPVDVSNLTTVTELAVGASHNCALLQSGKVYCWGDNALGRLGNGSAVTSSVTPVEVFGITNAIAISVGEQHSCAVLANGRVACWGGNGDGQLGVGSPASSSIPVFATGF